MNHPLDTPVNTSVGFVTAVVACLRRAPDVNSEVVTQAKMGETFRILAQTAGAGEPVAQGTPETEKQSVKGPLFPARWWHVALDYDGYEGFLPATDGQPGHPAPAQAAAVVRSLFANVYAGPSVEGRLVATLPIGVQVALQDPAAPDLGEAERWLPVRLPNGQEGFLQRGDLSLPGQEWVWNTPAQLRHSLVHTAHRFLGLPYRWGGTTPFGIDCSGFVQLLYRLHGLALPRDAHQQAQAPQTRPVSRDELIPGDLLFFGDYTHVGMAISHHEFIHATTWQEPVVQISAVDHPHWAGLRREIRRYVVPPDGAKP